MEKKNFGASFQQVVACNSAFQILLFWRTSFKTFNFIQGQGRRPARGGIYRWNIIKEYEPHTSGGKKCMKISLEISIRL